MARRTISALHPTNIPGRAESLLGGAQWARFPLPPQDYWGSKYGKGGGGEVGKEGWAGGRKDELWHHANN